jgi:hypothetical protein
MNFETMERLCSSNEKEAIQKHVHVSRNHANPSGMAKHIIVFNIIETYHSAYLAIRKSKACSG